MRSVCVGVLAALLLLAFPGHAKACDPYWDWCGDDWLDPYWGIPAYEEPALTWWWNVPVYEPEPVYVPEPFYWAPEPVYEPAPMYIPEPVYVPSPVYIPEPAYTPTYEAAPAYVTPPAYEPIAWFAPEVASVPTAAPALSDPFVWTAPGSDVLDASIAPASPVALTPVAAPDPAARAADMGLHRVTEVWTEHVTTRDGPVTTYSSSTATFDAGTQARQIAAVGTGEASAYDGIVLGGRMRLSDGRPVAGSIYENYAWSGYDWVVNGYVFFQDDSEIARLSAVPIPPPMPTAAPPAPLALAPPTSTAPAAIPVATSAPASVTPLTSDVPAHSIVPAPPSGAEDPLPRVVRVGIALAPQADPIARAEVLRGRRVPFWVRAVLDDVSARVVSWRLVSGEVIALGPISGSGEEPLLATFATVTRPGSTFLVTLRASVEVPGEGARELDASIEVIVRSPAIVQ